MAKKRNNTAEVAQRTTRKDELLARKQEEQTRQIKLVMTGVIGLLVLVFLVGIVNEFVLSPSRAVAVVGGEKITLSDWQERVKYERALRIVQLENQLAAFGGDVGIIQQFMGQMIVDLQDTEALAQGVLDDMTKEVSARQLAEARGISVSDAELDARVGESFSYYGGESPPPAPVPTDTVVPTPSLTPIPTAVISDVVATATSAPAPVIDVTQTPQPTATPVSEEAFQEQLTEVLDQLRSYGVKEDTYRSVIRAAIYQERLADALADENALPAEAEQASFFLLSFGTEDDAAKAEALIAETDFLTVWNTLKSVPSELDVEGTATEILWRTQDELLSGLGEDLTSAAFSLTVGEPSDVIVRPAEDPTQTRYFLLQVSGREVRPLSEQLLEQNKAELLTNFIDEHLAVNLESTEFWRSRVPTQPVLDVKFLAPPTPTPPVSIPDTGSGDSQVEPTPAS